MKTKSILAAMLLMVSTCVMADDYKFLTITQNGSEQDIYLPLVQKITFENNCVVVTTSEGQHTYPISILDKMTFTTKDNPDAIKALPEEAENLTCKDGTLSVKGDGLLSIYNTAGALISIANVKEGANINIGNLPTGVYVVRMGDKTIKIRK